LETEITELSRSRVRVVIREEVVDDFEHAVGEVCGRDRSGGWMVDAVAEVLEELEFESGEVMDRRVHETLVDGWFEGLGSSPVERSVSGPLHNKRAAGVPGALNVVSKLVERSRGVPLVETEFAGTVLVSESRESLDHDAEVNPIVRKFDGFPYVQMVEHHVPLPIGVNLCVTYGDREVVPCERWIGVHLVDRGE
jgi:hypothetical protein